MISISTKSKINLIGALLTLGTFLTIKAATLMGLPRNQYNYLIEPISIISFVFFFVRIARRQIEKNREIEETNRYSKKLSKEIIRSMGATSAYTEDGIKSMTKRISEVMAVERCSIWMYDRYQTSIWCEMLYDREDDDWEMGAVIRYEDYKPYFDHLDANQILQVSDTEKNPATSCFGTNCQLTIKSMLDVPITHKGKTIGVMCIESKKKRTWTVQEIDFCIIQASIYALSYAAEDTYMSNQ
jgi:hypothetical protein